jgi:hypothetical protein
MNRSLFILLISLVTAAAAVAEAAPPQAVEISYDIARNGTAVAEVAQRLDHDGKTYTLTESWKGKGILSLRGSAKRSSRGVVTPRGLRPLEYTDERTGRDTARATFDWTGSTLTQQYRAGPQQVALPPRPHDRLAFLFEFAFVPPGKSEVVFDVADGRGLSHQVYRVGERERTRVPAGEFQTLKLTRNKDGERADLWFAVDRNYLPVRIVITQKDGVVLEQVATRIAP